MGVKTSPFYLPYPLYLLSLQNLLSCHSVDGQDFRRVDWAESLRGVAYLDPNNAAMLKTTFFRKKLKNLEKDRKFLLIFG